MVLFLTSFAKAVSMVAIVLAPAHDGKGQYMLIVGDADHTFPKPALGFKQSLLTEGRSQPSSSFQFHEVKADLLDLY